jgi:hypothetical protein
MSSALRAAKRVLQPVPGRQFPGATPLPVGGRRQGLTYPDAGLVDDGAPSGAIVLNVPLKELGGGPGTLTVPDDASGGSAGDGLEREGQGGSRWKHTAALRLIWQTSDWVRGRHCRVPGKTGSNNQGFLALSGTESSRCQAEKQRSWFQVWALWEPRGANGTSPDCSIAGAVLTRQRGSPTAPPARPPHRRPPRGRSAARRYRAPGSPRGGRESPRCHPRRPGFRPARPSSPRRR